MNRASAAVPLDSTRIELLRAFLELLLPSAWSPLAGGSIRDVNTSMVVDKVEHNYAIANQLC